MAAAAVDDRWTVPGIIRRLASAHNVMLFLLSNGILIGWSSSMILLVMAAPTLLLLQKPTFQAMVWAECVVRGRSKPLAGGSL